MYQTYRQFSVFTTSVGLAALAPINSRRGCAAWVTVLRLGRPYFPEQTGTDRNATLKHGTDQQIRRMRKTSYRYFNVSLVM